LRFEYVNPDTSYRILIPLAGRADTNDSRMFQLLAADALGISHFIVLVFESYIHDEDELSDPAPPPPVPARVVVHLIPDAFVPSGRSTMTFSSLCPESRGMSVMSRVTAIHSLLA
jgi:hypothetical protein